MNRMRRGAGVRSVFPSSRLFISALFLILFLLVVGDVWLTDLWGWRSETFDFTYLQGADAFTIRIANQDVRTISDAVSVHTVARFAQDHQDRWAVPWSGVPVGRVRIEFLSQGRVIGDLEVGRGFVIAQQKGGFYSRSITINDQDQILGLLGLTPQDLG